MRHVADGLVCCRGCRYGNTSYEEMIGARRKKKNLLVDSDGLFRNSFQDTLRGELKV
jgi:hypothetical protein